MKERKKKKQGKEGKDTLKNKKDNKKTDENEKTFKISPAVTRNKSRLYYCQIFIFILLILSKYLNEPNAMSQAWSCLNPGTMQNPVNTPQNPKSKGCSIEILLLLICF